MKKAIITGSTGILGTSVAKFFTDNGIDVLCLGRKKLREEVVLERFGSKATYLNLNMEDILFLQKELCKIRWSPGDQCVFFHFAWSGDQKLTDGGLAIQMNNAVHAAHAVRAAKDIGCQKFVNTGSLEETFVEQHLKNVSAQTFQFAQIDYALAKLASRDMSKMVAYMEKVDYVHTRLSVPLLVNLSKGTYVSQTLKKIVNHTPYFKPESNRLFDIIAIDDVVRAYLMVGKYGKNKADYFIGTSRPSTLADYFEYTANQLNSKGKSDHFLRNIRDEKLFSTEVIYRDAGFSPLMQFEDIVQSLKGL